MTPDEEWAANRRRVRMPVSQRGELEKLVRVRGIGSMETLGVLLWPGLGAVKGGGVEDGKGARSGNGEFQWILCGWWSLAGQKWWISRWGLQLKHRARFVL